MSQDIWSYIVELHSGSSNSDSNSTTGSNKTTFFEYLPRFFLSTLYILSHVSFILQETNIIISIL